MTSSRRLSQEDKDAWEKRRKDGIEISQYYENHLQCDPNNLEGSLDKVMMDVNMSEGRTQRSVCRGCEGTVWRHEMAVIITGCTMRVKGYHFVPHVLGPSHEVGTGNGR